MVYGIPIKQLEERRLELIVSRGLADFGMTFLYDADATYHETCITAQKAGIPLTDLGVMEAQERYIHALKGETEGKNPIIVGERIFDAAIRLAMVIYPA